MALKDYLKDRDGKPSGGKLMGAWCVGGALGTSWLGLAFKGMEGYALRATAVLLLAGWLFYTGGKGLDRVEGWIRAWKGGAA
jgi:hypothetical protein